MESIMIMGATGFRALRCGSTSINLPLCWIHFRVALANLQRLQKQLAFINLGVMSKFCRLQL